MAKKLKVPKHIGGTKIPKSIRKGPLGEFLNSTKGQDLLAQAVLAAGEKTKVSHERLRYALSEAVAAFKRAIGDDAPEPRSGELDYESGADEPKAIYLQDRLEREVSHG